MKRNNIELCRSLRKNQTDAGICRDRSREEELSKLGVKMLRFDNLDILNNMEGVHEVIRKAIEEKRSNTPHLNPLPAGERGSD